MSSNWWLHLWDGTIIRQIFQYMSFPIALSGKQKLTTIFSEIGGSLMVSYRITIKPHILNWSIGAVASLGKIVKVTCSHSVFFRNPCWHVCIGR